MMILPQLLLLLIGLGVKTSKGKRLMFNLHKGNPHLWVALVEVVVAEVVDEVVEVDVVVMALAEVAMALLEEVVTVEDPVVALVEMEIGSVLIRNVATITFHGVLNATAAMHLGLKV